jgi:hypothetical protein
MKKKILLVLSVIFLLTGCDNVYNLTIEDDILKEEIISIIPDDKADAVDKMFIEEEDYPFFDNYKHKYKKVVKRSGNTTIVSLNYDYTIDTFKQSRTYNECFEKSVIKEEDGYLKFAFVGEFNCLYGDSLEINLRSNRKVVNSNAESVDEDVYTWSINRKNKNNVDIQFVLGNTNEVNTSSIVTIIFVILFVIIVIVDIYLFKKKKNKR